MLEEVTSSPLNEKNSSPSTPQKISKSLESVKKTGSTPLFCNSREERNRISAHISDDAIREKDKLIKTLQKKIDDQAKIIQNLRQQLGNQPRQLRKKR